jgi:hypothetical protein
LLASFSTAALPLVSRKPARISSFPQPAILNQRGATVTVNAHFDGKVIVPD